MDARAFELFGLPHLAALATTVAASIYLVRLNLSPTIQPTTKHRANVLLALILIAAVSLDPLLTWLRYRSNPALAGQLVRETALPFYLCDVVSLVLAYALICRKQRWAEVGYLWGLAGTVQGLITPTLYFSWDTFEYYAFFAQHGGVPVAAITLAYGTELRPQRGAFLRAVFWSWIYMLAVGGINGLLGANYGFLCAKPGVGTFFDYMGPYPWYLLTLQAVAFTFYLLLLIPFRPGKPARAPFPGEAPGG
jgi:hypothetical integral membrane protein (TIGR02206 family)